MKTLPTTIILALTMSACSKLFSPPMPPTPEDRQKEFVHCFREEMQPTDEQVKILEGRIFVDHPEIHGVAESLKKANEELEKGLESETADPVLLDRFHQVARLRNQLSEDHFKRMLVLRSVLTPEQRAKFLNCKRRMGPSSLPHE
ncbi:MAG: Spy/CpxP family protein refolding chaperone [Bdellovibrionota bacterium]